jgi:hypothetical protein
MGSQAINNTETSLIRGLGRMDTKVLGSTGEVFKA